MISFDDQRLAQAARDLAESEKLCAHESSSKFTRPINTPDKKVLFYPTSHLSMSFSHYSS